MVDLCFGYFLFSITNCYNACMFCPLPNVHFMAKSMWTPDHHTHIYLFNIPFRIQFPFAIIRTFGFQLDLLHGCLSLSIQPEVH